VDSRTLNIALDFTIHLRGFHAGHHQKRSIIYLLIIQAYAGVVYAQESHRPVGDRQNRPFRRSAPQKPTHVRRRKKHQYRQRGSPRKDCASFPMSMLPRPSAASGNFPGNRYRGSRYVNIRGLDANLNSVYFWWGSACHPPILPRPPAVAVPWLWMPYRLAWWGPITVTKTNLPEQDAEALGGTIEITPKTMPLGGKPFP